VQPLYKKLGYEVSLPVTEQAALEVLSLPVHPALSQAELDEIVKTVEGLEL
jgi:perosamine synthetase